MSSPSGILPARIATVVLAAAVAILGTVAVCAVAWRDDSMTVVRPEECRASAAILPALDGIRTHECAPGTRVEGRLVWEERELFALMLCQCEQVAAVLDAGAADVSAEGGSEAGSDAGGP